jgi:hypothetical protein
MASRQVLFPKRITVLKFTMLFEDGLLDGCMHRNIHDSDEEIIKQCNATNPDHWGKVIGITDKVITDVIEYVTREEKS